MFVIHRSYLKNALLQLYGSGAWVGCAGEGERRLNASLLRSLQEQDDLRRPTVSPTLGMQPGLPQQQQQVMSQNPQAGFGLPGNFMAASQAQAQLQARGVRPADPLLTARPTIPPLMPAFAAQMGVATQQAPPQQQPLAQQLSGVSQVRPPLHAICLDHAPAFFPSVHGSDCGALSWRERS